MNFCQARTRGKRERNEHRKRDQKMNRRRKRSHPQRKKKSLLSNKAAASQTIEGRFYLLLKI